MHTKPIRARLPGRRSLGWLKRLTSPVFFSRDASGNVQRGLAGVPRTKPLLFVGNHQVCPSADGVTRLLVGSH